MASPSPTRGTGAAAGGDGERDPFVYGAPAIPENLQANNKEIMGRVVGCGVLILAVFGMAGLLYLLQVMCISEEQRKMMMVIAGARYKGSGAPPPPHMPGYNPHTGQVMGATAAQPPPGMQQGGDQGAAPQGGQQMQGQPQMQGQQPQGQQPAPGGAK